MFRSSIRALAARPVLWPTAARQAMRMIPRRWWTHAPFLPVPSRRYLRFRSETQYGSHESPNPHDIVLYLEWCREQQKQLRKSLG